MRRIACRSEKFRMGCRGLGHHKLFDENAVCVCARAYGVDFSFIMRTPGIVCCGASQEETAAHSIFLHPRMLSGRFLLIVM